jgi:hypothetical protein
MPPHPAAINHEQRGIMSSTTNNMPKATVSNQLRIAGRTAIVTGAG